MDNSHIILRTARRFFFGTLLSRFSGLIRDMSMALCFGASPELAAFMVAYRLANLFRRLFGEGNIAAGFTPIFERRRENGFASAAIFYREASRSLAIVLAGGVVVLAGLFFVLSKIATSDWRRIAELSMWMAPGLFFICLYGLQVALMQCQKRGFWAAVAPVAFNFGWVASAFMARHTADPMLMLAIGVTAAFGLQWWVAAWQTKKEIPKDNEKVELFSSDVRKMAAPMALGIIGIGAVQFNSALDAIFAHFADASGPAYLWYAIRVQQLPLALFGIALSGALLAPLARAMKQGDVQRYHALLKSAFRAILTLMIPCSFALISLGRPALNLLFLHGGFSLTDIDETLHCLWGYAVGLVPSVFVLVLAQGFYAARSYAIPSVAALISVLFNGALNGWFLFGLGWKTSAIALATSLSACVNWAILVRMLQAPTIDWSLAVRLLFASLLPAAATLGVQRLLVLDSRLFALQVGNAALCLVVYVGGVLALGKVLGIGGELKALIMREEGRSPPQEL